MTKKRPAKSYNRTTKHHRGTFMFSSPHDIIQAALKWQRTRDEAGIKGMMAQLEAEEYLSEMVRGYTKGLNK
jgi:hypothetical protein